MPTVPTMIRRADPHHDLPAFAGLEARADGVLLEALGIRSYAVVWDAPPSGEERARDVGFLLAAAERAEGPIVGFVQVLERSGIAHLEQLAVEPSHARRGHGRALVEAACDEARRRGHEAITLRTYADVPFNAPFYASCGFRVVDEPAIAGPTAAPFLRGLEETEHRLGLDRWGRRVLMRRFLSR